VATIFAEDEIDFNEYMSITESDHRVRPAAEYAGQVIDFFHGNTNTGTKLPWVKTHGLIQFRKNEVTVWGGFNGHGKSLVLGQIMNHFIRAKEKVCIASMEMKPHITLARMCRQAANGIPSIDYITRYHSGTSGLLWLYDQQGMISGEKIIAVIRYAQEKFGIQHFVADSLLKFGYAEDDYNGQKRFVDALCSVARDTGVHVHLVHHSRKAKDEYAVPNKFDMKGSGSIIDQVDNLIVIWRNKKKEETDPATRVRDDADVKLVVEKQRNGEWEGHIKFWFDAASGSLVEAPIPGY
jgi:twinkle protein